MLTLYYATATFMQSWRIKNVCTKIGQELAQKMSVSFYTLPTGSDDGFDPTLAASDLCCNRNAARISEILWLSGSHRGCCLSPLQVVQLMPWISFDENMSKIDTTLLPFAHSPAPTTLLERLEAMKSDQILHLLLETETQPCHEFDYNMDFVRIENFGKLIAWKVDSHLAVLIETDVEHFTKLLLSTYLQNNCIINDQLKLLRIESINHEGKPQPLSLLASHLRKPIRNSEQKLSAEEWQRHLDDLRSMSVLAHQATEFESQKNRGEGKSVVGVRVKPDLIPYEQQLAAFDAQPKASCSKEIEASAVNKGGKSSIGSPSIKTDSTVTPSKTNVEKLVKNTAPSPSKLHAKPTEIKKSAAMFKSTSFGCAESGSKTTKVSELANIVAEPKKASSETSTSIKCLEQTPTFPLDDPPITISAAAAVITTTITRAKMPTSSFDSKSNELNKLATEAVTSQTQIQQKEKPTTAEVTPAIPNASQIDELTLTSNSTSVTSTSAPLTSNSAAKRPSLKRYKNNRHPSKPTNIYVYSESVSSRESALSTLKTILEHDKYTIYAMTPQQLEQKYWMENTALMVVCGTVPTNIGEILVDYFLCGGKVLSLCSDILNFVLPNYRTAEVRENELVQFSYDKWQKIKMMHHIFCYQPSPVKKNFSTESEDAMQTNNKKPSVELQDLNGDVHNLDVKVLGIEETWNTPSLLLANNAKSGGCAVFSQVHLETNPSQFELDELKYKILKQNEQIRLEILADLLSKHLNVSVQQKESNAAKVTYQEAYFLGRHESKFEVLGKLKKSGASGNIVTTSKLTMQFCGKGDKPKSANTNVLPILIHSCPEDFSTVEYFDNLKTNYIGRLVIYAPIVSSSMNVVSELELTDGIAVLVRQQTEGVGRSNNLWLSPLGCAMFSIQLHISLDTPLGGRLPLLQHLIGAAVVNTLKGNETYKNLDIHLKWPNDIYANGVQKIGGIIVKTIMSGPKVIVNLGCGINLDNEKPTTCINAMIREQNLKNHSKIPILKYEQFVALTFNEIENLLEKVKLGKFDYFYNLYYKLWMHDSQNVKICDTSGKQHDATIIGIDDIGYLKVKTVQGLIETVQPDGNSFDMLQGLIVPKFN
ncbi:uncharacterized protein Hcs isoform X2 [Eurosta solidaginis]|uniref:uncharacterized protein Hcs isoform X2 n=1 Tax=Eurosta solidaginis TaxID=178769 RepID=UPI00353177BD